MSVRVCVFDVVDVHSGILLATLDEFVESKSYVVCVLTPDAQFLLVGEPSETRLFTLTAADEPTSPTEDTEVVGLQRRRPIARFPVSHPPSALAISADSRCAFAGQSFDCLLSVLDIDLSSPNFGQVSRHLLLSFSVDY